ncbi:MAG: SIR2 family protein [Candidatus Bathyarchaeota archaeon]
MSLQSNVNIPELAAHLKAGELNFFVGAGISKNEPSCLPLWNELVRTTLQALIGKSEFEILEKHLPQLRSEVLTQLLEEQLGDLAYTPLEIALGSKTWNRLHLFLAWAMIYHNASVLTPNLDVLIETAAKDRFDPSFKPLVNKKEYQSWSREQGGLLKQHGTIEDHKSIRAAVNVVAKGLPEWIREAVNDALESPYLVVLGYRGADEFDINRILFRQRPSTKLFWIFHKGSKDEYTDLLWRRLLRLQAIIDETDTPEFLKKLYLATVELDPQSSFPELDSWASAMVSSFETRSNVMTTEPSWKSNLSIWASEISVADSLRAWARILEYVSEYEVAIPVCRRCIDHLGAKPSLRLVNAQFRLGWMLRRTGRYDQSLRWLSNSWRTLDEICEQDSSLASKAQLLRGDILHQKGVSLHNVGKYELALKVVLSAENLRREMGDEIGVAFTRFQRFMLGEVASRSEMGSLDMYAPHGWRATLRVELGNAARKLKRNGNIRNFAVVNHNIAFLEQFRAKEAMESKNWQEATLLLGIAIRKYHFVKRYRKMLYDPMQLGLTYARLADCYQVKAESYFNLGDIKAKNRSCRKAFKYAQKAIEIFERIPDPTRINQVKQLTLKIQDICGTT